MYEKHQKKQQQQKTQSATYGFYLDIIDTSVGKCSGVQARRGVRGPPGPTILIIKEIVRLHDDDETNKANYDNRDDDTSSSRRALVATAKIRTIGQAWRRRG